MARGADSTLQRNRGTCRWEVPAPLDPSTASRFILRVFPHGQVQFRPAQPLTPEALTAIATQVCRRVPRWFARSGLLEAAHARDMLGWEHGGCSLDAATRIAGGDRAGLERLLRYCTRPPFALERLVLLDEERVVHLLPKPQLVPRRWS